MTKFNIGDAVWRARCARQPVKQLCPTCYGKKEVTLILGNGDHVILPCMGCAPGCQRPTGYVDEYELVIEPELFTITGLEIQDDGKEQKVTYRNGCYLADEEILFKTKEEAAKKSAEIKVVLEENQICQAMYIKHNMNKSYSWNAHYHIRQASHNRKEALYHEKMAKICKEKSKDDPTRDR